MYSLVLHFDHVVCSIDYYMFMSFILSNCHQDKQIIELFQVSFTTNIC